MGAGTGDVMFLSFSLFIDLETGTHMDALTILIIVLVVVVVLALLFALVRRKQRSGSILAAPGAGRQRGGGS